MKRQNLFLLSSIERRYINPRLCCGNLVCPEPDIERHSSNYMPAMYIQPKNVRGWNPRYQLAVWKETGPDFTDNVLDTSKLNKNTDVFFPKHYIDTGYPYILRQSGNTVETPEEHVLIFGIAEDEHTNKVWLPIEAYTITQNIECIGTDILDPESFVRCVMRAVTPSYTEPLKTQPFAIDKFDGHIFQFGTINAKLKNIDEFITADLYIGEVQKCFTGSTLILLSDGSWKTADQLTINDVVVCWDFDNGCLSYSPLLWVAKRQSAIQYQKIITDKGRVFENINNHRLFSLSTNKFESCLGTMGHQLWTVDGEETVVKIEQCNEKVDYYNAISANHMNIITNGFLSSIGYNNLYPIQDMQYVNTPREYRPIEMYGDIPQQWYDSLRLSEHYCDPSTVKPYIERCLQVAV